MRAEAVRHASFLNSYFLLVFPLTVAAFSLLINAEAQLRKGDTPPSKSSLNLHTSPKIGESWPKSSFAKSGNNFISSSSRHFLSYENFFASPNLHLKSIRDESSSPFRKWGESGKMKRSNRTEKETKIAAIFMGVAYGNEEEKKKKMKPYFVAEISNKANGNKLSNHERNNMQQEPSLLDSYAPALPTAVEMPSLFQQPKRVQKSLKFYHEKPKSEVKESSASSSSKINFSLPQLFLSTEEKSAELGFYYYNPQSMKENYLDNDAVSKVVDNGPDNSPDSNYDNDYTLVHKTDKKMTDIDVELDFKDDIKYNKSVVNATMITRVKDYETTQLEYNRSVAMQGYFDKDDFNWTFIQFYYSTSWKYQDYFVLAFFSAVSFFPLFVIFHLQIASREHVTPRYCFLLMLQLLIVCWSRVILYCVDPFGLHERFPQFLISIFHILAQSLLIYSTGLFLVILVFPVYSPKSQILPRVLAALFLSLFYAKLGTFLFFSIRGNSKTLKAVQRYVTAVDFGEIGSLFIGYIFLNLCTRQRHKVWWIRLYKKSLNSTSNTYSVLYSFLKKAIRFGTVASAILLINTFWIISVNFNLKLFYLSLYTSPLSGWILETIKRVSEGLACSFLAIGSCYLFVPKERLVFRKRSSLKALSDVIKGRRRSGSQSSLSKVMQPLNIFTLNRSRKATDYATTDFQLVWNQNRSLPLAAMAEATDDKRRRSAKSLDFEEAPSSLFGKSKDMKLSRSVDILNGVYESKSHGSFAIYDNLQQRDKNRTPIYQNQYFHYNYKPKANEFNASQETSNICKSNSSLSNSSSNFINPNKRKNKRKPRPKSYMEERPKVNENYLTSYFSILSMDSFVDGDPTTKSYMLSHHNTRDRSESKTLLPYSTEDIVTPLQRSTDEIHSPMISDDKWKDIKITPKSCTIKINSKKKLSTSKSVDFF